MYKLAAFAALVFASSCAETSSEPLLRNDGRSIPSTKSQLVDTMSTDLPEMVAPRIVIMKHQRILEVFDGEKLIKTFRISLGFTPVGNKEREGDGKTPEGEFYIFTRNPKSQFYLSLGISYPGIGDAERGLRDRLISSDEYDAIVEAVKQKKMPPQTTALGGLIYLHGGGTGKDWTYGCAALADEDIRELFNAIPTGTPITILP